MEKVNIIDKTNKTNKTNKTEKWYVVLKNILIDYGETEEEAWKQVSEPDRKLLDKTLKSVDNKAPKTEPKQSEKTKKELNKIRKSIQDGTKQVKREPKLKEAIINHETDKEREM